MPFPLPSRPQVRTIGRSSAWRTWRGRVAHVRVVRTVRDDGDEVRVDAVLRDEALPCRPRHRDDGLAVAGELDEDHALALGRRGEDGVEHDDRRDRQRSYDVQDVDAVGAAEDAVLVLDDRDIAGVQARGRRPGTGRVIAHPLLADLAWEPGLDRVHHGHDLDHVVDTAQRVDEGRAERCEPALRGRIGAEHSVMGHDAAFIEGVSARTDA